MQGSVTSCRVIWKFYAVRVTGRNTAKRIAAYTVRDKAGKPHPCEQTGHLINDLYRRYIMNIVPFDFDTNTLRAFEING
jgi:hypothetical protein